MTLIVNTDDTIFKKILDSIPEEYRAALISPSGVAYLSKLVAVKYQAEAPNVAISYAKRAKHEYSTPVANKSKFATEKSQASYLAISSSKRSREEHLAPGRMTRRELRSISLSRPMIIQKSNVFFENDDFRLFRGGEGGEPLDASLVTRTIAPVDLPNRDKVDEVPEYITDIMQRLFEREFHTRPHSYMETQTNITANMRSILIDWLSEIQLENSCDASTFYLCTNICDRYLERVLVDREKLQLLGVTAFSIACKAEETFHLSVHECADLCAGAYTPQEILDMEKKILRELKHQVSVPTGYPFLLRFLYITKATEIQRNAAHYYMKLMVNKHASLKYRPSLIAVSCVVLALNNKSIRSLEKIKGIPPGMPKVLRYYTGFVLLEVLEVANEVCLCVNDKNNKKWVAQMKEKYASSEFNCVSLFDGPDVLDILDDFRSSETGKNNHSADRPGSGGTQRNLSYVMNSAAEQNESRKKKREVLPRRNRTDGTLIYNTPPRRTPWKEAHISCTEGLQRRGAMVRLGYCSLRKRRRHRHRHRPRQTPTKKRIQSHRQLQQHRKRPRQTPKSDTDSDTDIPPTADTTWPILPKERRTPGHVIRQG